MPVIRFVREGRDVECYPGENLREVALREGIELYGLKGKLGNCGGCGQCITCFVDVEGADPLALTPCTPVEDLKLRRRPSTWRLACQALVQRSLVVLTRPQVGLPDRGRNLSSRPRLRKGKSNPLRAMKLGRARTAGGDTVSSHSPLPWKPTISVSLPAFFLFWFRLFF
jgi:ferredoxin